jgi:hypothetical protein
MNQADAIVILKAFAPNLHGVEGERLRFEAGNRAWPCIPILPREHLLQHSEIVIRTRFIAMLMYRKSNRLTCVADR